jgi:hypothetical protein
MARYTPYKEQRATSVVDFHVDYLVEVLRFLNAKGIGTQGDLLRVRARGLLSESLWKLGEANLLPNRKYNLRFFSEGAHAAASAANRVPASKSRDNVEHEHVVPRTILETRLLECDGEVGTVRSLARLAMGCVITAPEHRLLQDDPWGADDPALDPWRRYRNAGIQVYDRKNADWVDLKKGVPA